MSGGYIRTISEQDLDNAKWHFNNNMTNIMPADRINYRNARADIAYLLELAERRELEISKNGGKVCPRCDCEADGNFCSNCGQALK